MSSFEPFIDEVHFSYLYQKFVNRDSIDLRTYRVNVAHTLSFIVNYEKSPFSKLGENKTRYENAKKEKDAIEKHFEDYWRLVEERHPYIGNWSKLDLFTYIINEAENKWLNSKGENACNLNPPFGCFIKIKELTTFFNSKKRIELTDKSPLELESNFNIAIQNVLLDLIGLIKKFINSDIDCLLKRTKRYLDAENHTTETKFIINFGNRVSQPINTFRSEYYDQYLIKVSGKEFSFKKKVDSLSKESKIVSIYLVNEKRIVHLLISPDKLLERSEYIIKKDIKKVNIVDSILEIHYHGHFSPDSIVFDNYESALEMQRYITNQRY